MFQEEIREAEEKLYERGYYVANMIVPNNKEYEIYNGDCQVVMDHLTVSQLIQLSKFL